MENFETKTPEKIANPECIKFAEEIRENVVNTFPFMSDDERDTFLDKFNEILEDKEALSNPELLVKNIRIALASLDNTHTVLKEHSNQNQYVLENPIYYKAHKFWTQTEKGMVEVVSLNGIPIMDVINKGREEVGGGTEDWQIDTALQTINVSNTENPVVLETSEGVIDTKFGKPKFKNKPVIEGKTISDGIGYLNIGSWSGHIKRDGKDVGELVEEELQKVKDNGSLIIDIRKNSGGNSAFAQQLAEHFMDKERKFTDCLKRVPDKEELDKREFTIGPKGEFLDRKVVILTSHKCLSSSELFILMLKETGRAITIGETTGGGSGCPTSFGLHLGDKGFTLNVSTWRLQRNNGQMLESQGIEPTIPVEVTDDDVINHRDAELEKAVEYLNG